MEVRLREQLDEALENLVVQEREAETNLRKQLTAARQKTAAQVAEAEEEFETHMAQANKKIKRLENELRETKAELEASGPGLRAAAPSPVQAEPKPAEEISNELETELRHSLNKAEARILELTSEVEMAEERSRKANELLMVENSQLELDLIEAREELSSLDEEWKLSWPPQMRRQRQWNLDFSLDWPRPKTMVKTSLRQSGKRSSQRSRPRQLLTRQYFRNSWMKRRIQSYPWSRTSSEG